jgi:RNA polymerase sigma factor (sigma-70 family)
MIEDTELLRHYIEENSEEAFATLVRRHLDFVYGVALRRVGGNQCLAEEVAQTLFTDLARKARTLQRHPALSAWLFRSARFAAAQAMRSERRRRGREDAFAMHEITQSSDPDPDWEHLRPALEDALDALPERDRTAVGLRFFDGCSFADVGKKIASSEEAARLRVYRALETLRGTLGRRGITSTSAALAALLARPAAAAPAHLATSITSAAISAATSATSLGLLAPLATLGLMKIPPVILSVSLVANAIFATAYITGQPGWSEPPQTRRRAATASSYSAAAAPSQLTDAVAIGRRLQAAGFSDEVVKWVVRVAVAEKFGDARQQFGAELKARVRRWNPAPQPSRAVAPGLVQAERTRPDTPMMEYTEAAWRELGYDSSGNPVQSQYRNLSREKAALVNKIEDDYRSIREKATVRTGNMGSLSRADANRIEEEFEADIRAALSPSEAIDYFRYNSGTAKQVHSILGDVPVTEGSYAAITDAVLEFKQQTRKATDDAVGAPIRNMLAIYRRELGDERFLQVAARLPAGNIYLPLDPIYQAANLSALARADLLVEMAVSITTMQAAEPAHRAFLAAQTRAAFTTGAGLNADQVAAFDASRTGKLLLQLVGPAPSNATHP